jgi:hypothetical protein
MPFTEVSRRQRDKQAPIKWPAQPEEIACVIGLAPLFQLYREILPIIGSYSGG